MPALSQHQSNRITKLLMIGDSGMGKTGALASLAMAGYNVRIIDFDNGLSVLKSFLTDPKSPYVQVDPECASRVEFETCTDKMKSANGRIWATKAEAWPKAVSLLSNWKTPSADFGPVSSWTPDDVLVIDSLSKASDAALNQHLGMNAILGQIRTQNEARRDIGAAQNLIRDLLQLLYDVQVNTNVIVMSHITMVTEAGGAPGKNEKGDFDVSAQGYPSAIGRSLSPQIPRWFDSMLICKADGSGSSTRRRIFTKPQVVAGQQIAAKSSAPLSVKDVYPLETGLAEYLLDAQGKTDRSKIEKFKQLTGKVEQKKAS